MSSLHAASGGSKREPGRDDGTTQGPDGKAGFVMIPADLAWELPGEILGLYARIRYRDRGNGCWASLADLKGPLSEDQTRRNLRDLQRRGLVDIEQRIGRPNLVRCTPCTSATPCTHARGGTHATPPLAPMPGAPCMDATPPLAPMPPEVDPEVDPRNRSSEIERAAEAPAAAFHLEAPAGPRKPKGKRTAPPAPVALPEWLPAALWQEWRDHRKAMGHPLTPQAEAQGLRDLAKLREQGHDPRAVVENAIALSWRGLYAPLGGQRTAGPPPTARPSGIDRLAQIEAQERAVMEKRQEDARNAARPTRRTDGTE